MRRPGEGCARRLNLQAPHRDPGHDQLVGDPRRGREGGGVEGGEGALGIVEASDQQQAPDLEMPRMGGVQPVAVRVECRSRGVKRLRRPAEVAGDERDLGLGDDAAGAGHGLPRTEGAGRPAQQGFRANEIAELRHRDAAKGKCRCVVAQGDPVQCAERITGRERASRRSDQRIHPNPATLVTLTVRMPGPSLSRAHQPTPTEMRTMTTHMTGTREEWLSARLALIEAEKELTRRSDELVRQRQALPWVRVDKEYRFETDEGEASLADLFQGRSQLLVYHFMFGPDYKAGCPSCSAIADGFDGFVVHLANHDVTLSAVSRAPLAKLQAYRRRMGWSFPWASSVEGEFNFDFNVSFTEEQQRKGCIEYNYERGGHAMDATQVLEPVAQFAASCGTDAPTYSRDRPGLSAFVLEDGVVHHSYSTYARGLDGLWGMYQWLDRAPRGRNETGIWWRRHDEYDQR